MGIVESLVFIGGHVVGSDRIRLHPETLTDGIREMIHGQHRGMVGQVQAGSFDEGIRRALEREKKHGPAEPEVASLSSCAVGDSTESAVDDALLGVIVRFAQEVQLVLELPEDPWREGKLCLRACSSRGGDPVSGADIRVSVAPEASSPSHDIGRATTGPDGYVVIPIDLALDSAGALEVVISGRSEIGTTAIRRRLEAPKS